MRQTGGKKPDKKQFFKLFQSGWKNSATVETAQSGFRQTGIFPVNRNAIPVEVFEPSKTTERRSQTVTKEGTSSTEVASYSQAVTDAEVATDLQQSMSTSDTMTASGLI